MRKENDSMGEILVPEKAYWGAQTQRSLHFFCIGKERMPEELIEALVLIKKAAALSNNKLKRLSARKMGAIIKACDEILAGKLLDQFPLVVWQTGSGTQTNMNVNEVIANRANELLGSKKGTKAPVHPNDDVNMSQSSNDVFPSACNIACLTAIQTELIPSLKALQKALRSKAQAFSGIIKVGRTHLMDAVPLTLGQEFSGYAAQVAHGIEALQKNMPRIEEIALGATAVGTGLNAPKTFGKECAKIISKLIKLPIIQAKNPFEALASSDGLVLISGVLQSIACSLYKIANDIRWLASGPRCGLGELLLPENEPGSSIMPGKVNPTQSEALMMVCMQVMGNHTAVSFAGSQGNFELNVCRPLIVYNILQSIQLLADASKSFCDHCVKGIKANKTKIKEHLDRSLMHAAALNPAIGYDSAAKIVQKAHKENKTLKQAALELSLLTESEFDRITNPAKLI